MTLFAAFGRMVWYWSPSLSYAVLMFYLSSHSNVELYLPDKVAHGIEYFGFTVLLLHALRVGGPRSAARHGIAFAISVAILYGVTDEIHQMFLPLREPSIGDVFADAIGSCIAVAVWRSGHLISARSQVLAVHNHTRDRNHSDCAPALR